MANQRTSASEPRAGATRTLEKAGIALVCVPEGQFDMGPSADDTAMDDARPKHAVHLDGYWIGQTEVTNAQYRRFMEVGGYSNREYWTKEGWQWLQGSIGITKPEHMFQERFNAPQQPVVGVSWYEADAYARWAGGRLPTEAEWEYAARGGPLSKGYLYAGSDDVDKVAWYDVTPGRRTQRVGQKRPNELGLYDMSGNAYEWCADWYGAGYYAESPRENPLGPESGEQRVVRGGSWGNSPWVARCTSRYRASPNDRTSNIGFRLAVGS